MIHVLENDKKNRSSVFLMSNIPLPVINSLRRIILSDFENSALNVSNISIFKKPQNQPKEFISHRISLIPIKTKDICSFELNVINTTNAPIYVTSNDFKIVSGKAKIYPDIIICKLQIHEELQIVATNDFNTSQKGGTIYRPVFTSFFKKAKGLYIKKSAAIKTTEKKVSKYLDNCGFNLYENNYIDSFRVEKPGYHFMGISDNMRDIDASALADFLHITDDEFVVKKIDNHYVFEIESIFINPKKILKMAMKILLKQIKYFLKQSHRVETIKTAPSNHYPYPVSLHNDFCRLLIRVDNTSCTVLNPFLFFMKEHENILFAHYNKTHPFNKEMEMHITIKKENQGKSKKYGDIKKIIKETYKYMKSMMLKYITIVEE